MEDTSMHTLENIEPIKDLGTIFDPSLSFQEHDVLPKKLKQTARFTNM